VFQILLQMIPGLEDRLMDGDDEVVISIADMVRHRQHLLIAITKLYNSFKRAYPVQDLMTQKV
jgi:hypothetical protein